MGQKIFTLPISVSPFASSDGAVKSFPNVGLAFAGNTLVAQSTVALVSTVLSNLVAANAQVGPQMADIADLVKRCMLHVVQEQRFWRGGHCSAELLLFGFSAPEGDPELYDIYLDENEQGVSCHAKKMELEVGGLGFLGSGAEALNQLMAEKELAGVASVKPLALLREIIYGHDDGSVGGGIQFARGTLHGVRIHPVMEVTPSGMANPLVLGVPVQVIGSVGEFIPFDNLAVIEVDTVDASWLQ